MAVQRATGRSEQVRASPGRSGQVRATPNRQRGRGVGVVGGWGSNSWWHPSASGLLFTATTSKLMSFSLSSVRVYECVCVCECVCVEMLRFCCRRRINTGYRLSCVPFITRLARITVSFDSSLWMSAFIEKALVAAMARSEPIRFRWKASPISCLLSR